MKVIIVEPQKNARVAEIGDKLEDIQAIIGKSIELFFPYHKLFALVLNADGAKLGLEPSFAFGDDKGSIYRIISGTFIIAGVTDSNLVEAVSYCDNDVPYTDDMFTSIQDEYIEGVLKDFTVPHGRLELTEYTLGEAKFIKPIDQDSVNSCLLVEAT